MLVLLILLQACSAAVRKDQEHDQDQQQLRGRLAARDPEFVLDIAYRTIPARSFFCTCHPERSEGSLTISEHGTLSSGNSQRCFASLNMTGASLNMTGATLRMTG